MCIQGEEQEFSKERICGLQLQHGQEIKKKAQQEQIACLELARLFIFNFEKNLYFLPEAYDFIICIILEYQTVPPPFYEPSKVSHWIVITVG